MVDARAAARPDHPGRVRLYDDHALFDNYSGVVLDIERASASPTHSTTAKR